MLDKIKRFLKRNYKYENENILLVALRNDNYLFEQWCLLDFVNSGEEATKESIFEFIAVEDELLRRGFGDEEGKIVPSKINNFYKGLFCQNS